MGKSSGSSGSGVDKAYNARMATIAESQQGMADKYFSFWDTYQKPLEIEQIKANTGLIPYQTDAEKASLGLQKAQSNAQLRLLPLETKARKTALNSDIALTPLKTETAKTLLGSSNELLTMAGKGINVNDRIGEAGADMAQGYGQARSIMTRDAVRSGIDQNSSQYRRMVNTLNLDRAKSMGGAMTSARRDAEDEQFNKMQSAISTVRGGL